MSEEPKTLQAVYKTEDEIVNTIVSNSVMMLSRRIYMADGKKHNLLVYAEAMTTLTDLGEKTFKLKGATKDYVIKIIFQKVTSLGKPSTIIDFLDKYKNAHKIIVVGGYNASTAEDLHKQPNVELFLVDDLMSDVVTHELQPRFELLSQAEMDALKKEYNITNKQFMKLERADPVTKYFNLKRDDIIRIIRPSPTAVRGITYRIVG